MPDPNELPGPLAFERQQGLHTIPVVEIPPLTTDRLVTVLRREVQYPFQVLPSVPMSDQLLSELDNRGVLCFPNVDVQTGPTTRWSSKARLSVFIAHGGRNIHKRHIIGWQGKIIESRPAFESLNRWCDSNGVPKPHVFVSCDERVSSVTTRWDQSSKYPVIGFSGGDNWISSDPATNTLTLHMDQMRRDQIGPNPFSSPGHANRHLVNELFILRIGKP